MMEIFANQYIIHALKFAVFYYVRRLQYRKGWVLLNPILVAIVLLIAYLKLTGVSFETFEESGRLIDFWLKPAVVALGVPLYLQFEAIKKLWFPIVLSQLVGCLVGIVSVVMIAQICGASKVVVISMASKSVTTPIAMEVTEALGGIPSLTALGHINSPIAQGLSMGAASHAVGASTAMSVSNKYGAFASLGITLNGIFTALLTPTILRLLGLI